MTLRKYNTIKTLLGKLAHEFEDVSEPEQQRITQLTTTVTDQISHISLRMSLIRNRLVDK